MPDEPEQRALFDLSPPPIAPAAPDPAVVALAAELPPDVRLGGMAWSYPGWRGLVHADEATANVLFQRGLPAYAAHPLLRAVELDHTFYGPVPAGALRRFAEQVPDDFRFVVKAHRGVTIERYPANDRSAKLRDRPSAEYLDPVYATEAIVGPTVDGLGSRLGILLFQFSPMADPDPAAFAERLGVFLEGLPRGPTYAVELRNASLLGRGYVEALERGGAIHCHNVWSHMPDVITQIRRVPPPRRRPLFLRWVMRRGDSYADAERRSGDFSRLVWDDPGTRASLATLVAKASAAAVPVFVTVNNHAEGSAPRSLELLARAILAKTLASTDR